MAQYLESFPSVNLLSLEVKETSGMFEYQYRAKEGLVHNHDYGIKLAAQYGLPDEIVQEAYDLKSKLVSNEVNDKDNLLIIRRKIAKRRLLLETASKLSREDMTEDEIQLLKEQFNQNLEALEYIKTDG